MSANSFGEIFKITTFGESHGTAMGVVIDGCPAGVLWDESLLRHQLQRRRPGSSQVVSARDEHDSPRVLSGVFEGKTLGTPIAIVVENHDARSADYSNIAQQPRPGHADDVWKLKFGHVDHRGGGRSSGRETISRVMAGAVAQMLVRQCQPELRVQGFASQIAHFHLTQQDYAQLSSKNVDQFPTRFPSEQEPQLQQLLIEAKQQGQSYGGIAEVWIEGVPAGLGQPVFKKLKSDFAAAMMSVGATSGFEVGEGFSASEGEGSEFHRQGESPYGGLRGGISTGEKIVLKCGFKPTSSVLDVAKKGRHDPCIVPRAIPVLEAMAWLVLADQLLWNRLSRL